MAQEGRLVPASNSRRRHAERSPMAKKRILLVEDDKALADVLVYNLQQAGYDVSVAHDGRTALHQGTSCHRI